MGVRIEEIEAKSVLNRSGIPGADYCINPYRGCTHGCRYCYATFMQRFTGHTEPWGAFVDAKVNAPAVLEGEARRRRKGRVMFSSVTDAYQPLEARYRLTRRCLEVLVSHQYPVDILTKSPLVVRDLDLLTRFEDIEVGLTVTTDDEKMRKVFEPFAPPIGARIRALAELRRAGLRTYVFIGPVLPMDPENLVRRLSPVADSVLIDSMHYTWKTSALYDRLGIGQWLDADFLEEIMDRLRRGFSPREVVVC